MVDKLYLTENIFSLDNKLYYEKDEKVQEVKNHKVKKGVRRSLVMWFGGPPFK